MKKIYEKNELTFSLIWIGIYVVLTSVLDGVSKDLGIIKLLTAPMHIAMVIYLALLIKKLDIAKKCGLCRWVGSMKAYLWFVPLAVVVSTNFWGGAALKFTALEALLRVASMLCVGFLEEIIFRGFLFNAILKNGKPVLAIVISSVTFGIGHIVNLLNGEATLSVLLQICYATALGFLFTIILYKGKSLLPCIAAHSLINSTSTFGAEVSDNMLMITSAIICIIAAAYALWIWKAVEKEGK